MEEKLGTTEISKREKRREKIKELLKEDPSLTQEKLAKFFGVCISTIKKDYAAIRNPEREATKTDKAFDKVRLKSASYAVKFISLLSTEDTGNNEILNSEENIVSRATLFRNVLPNLKENDLIVKGRTRYVNKMVYVNKNVFMTSLPENDSDILNFAAYSLSSKHMYGNDIYRQCMRYLQGKNLVISSQKDTAISKLPFYIQTLKKIHADESPISFEYKGIRKPFFYLGFIAYSVDKDVLYLVGTESPTSWRYKVFKTSEINWELGLSPKELKKMASAQKGKVKKTPQNKEDEEKEVDDNKNKMYKTEDVNFLKKIANKDARDKLFCDLLKYRAEMFDVAEENLEKVEVRIEYSPQVGHEVKSLYFSRMAQWDKVEQEMKQLNPKEELTDHERPSLKYFNGKDEELGSEKGAEYIVYSDVIRGISNFAKYLRKFGSCVTVLENKKLKQTIKTGASRALSFYEGDE